MFRSVASKVAWVGRTASMVFGLALVLALLFGVASMAFAADGNPFLLGTKNVAQSVSTLVKQGAGPALQLRVESGQPPLAVNSTTTVANLKAEFAADANRAYQATKATSADMVDGSDGELWAQIDQSGIARNWKGMTEVHRSSAGDYVITFNRAVSDCAYLASISMGSGIQDPGYISASGVAFAADALVINTYNTSGARADRAFHIVVFCGAHQSG